MLVRFPGHKALVSILPAVLSRDPTPLFAGGFKPGDRLYYSGCAVLGYDASGKHSFKLSFGERGEVALDLLARGRVRAVARR